MTRGAILLAGIERARARLAVVPAEWLARGRLLARLDRLLAFVEFHG